MKSLIVVICLLPLATCYSQPKSERNTSGIDSAISWRAATNWKIYSCSDRNSAYYLVDTLKNFKSGPLLLDSVRRYLEGVRPIVSTWGAVWQGFIIGSCEINHVPRKVIFSTYGGFFFDSQTEVYYEIPPDLAVRRSWHSFLMASLRSADPDASIP